MYLFKVVCKGRGNWERTLPARLAPVWSFFGFIKRTHVVVEKVQCHGPQYNELCLVTDLYTGDGGVVYYQLAGYPDGEYNSEYFVRLDELIDDSESENFLKNSL